MKIFSLIIDLCFVTIKPIGHFDKFLELGVKDTLNWQAKGLHRENKILYCISLCQIVVRALFFVSLKPSSVFSF